MIIKVGDRVRYMGTECTYTVTFLAYCTCGETYLGFDKEIESLFDFTCICGTKTFIPRNSYYTHNLTIVEEDEAYEKLLESL
jgi:hypothetical protein